MHEFSQDLWKLAKEFGDSPMGGILKTLASVLIVAGAAWRIAGMAGRGVRSCWRWLVGSKETHEDGSFPEGA